MTIKFADKTILVAVETTYGTDAAPTGSANAIQIMDVSIVPMAGGTVTFDYVRPDLGARPKIPVNTHVTLSFAVAVAGRGTAGQVPGYGVLFRGCGMSQTTHAAAAIQASPATSVGTPTGTFTYVAGDAYAGAVPRTVTLTCTTGGGSGVAEFTVGAPAAGPYAAYSQTGVVMTDEASFVLPNSATITPTVGTAFQAGDAYTIDLLPAHVAYQPIGANEESLTIYFNMGGNRHRLTGVRGTFSLDLNIGAMPLWKFDFVGLHVDPDAASQPSVDLTPFRKPVIPGADNTRNFSLHGYAGAMSSLSLAMGVQAKQADWCGGLKEVEIGARDGSGRAVIKSPLISEHDFFGAARDATLGAMRIVHGTTAGNIVTIDCPAVQVSEPTYGQKEGTATLELPLTLVPVDGNDEIVIRVM